MSKKKSQKVKRRNKRYNWEKYKQEYLKGDYVQVRSFFRRCMKGANKAFFSNGNYSVQTAGWRKEKDLLLEEQLEETKKAVKLKYAMTGDELERVKWVMMKAITQIAVRTIKLDSEGKVILTLEDIPKLITAINQVKLEKGEVTERGGHILEKPLSEDDQKLIDKLEKEFGNKKKARRT